MQKKYPNENIKKELDLENFLPIMEIHQYVKLFFENKNIDYSLPEKEIKKLEFESFYN